MMAKPGNFGNCRGDTLRKCRHLALQVDEEDVQTLPTNDLDSAVRDVGLVECYGAPRSK